jgi:hypothetical protein
MTRREPRIALNRNAAIHKRTRHHAGRRKHTAPQASPLGDTA